MKRYECICEGCKSTAEYFVYTSMEPHCAEHTLYAMGAVATEVIDIEAYEYAQRKEVVKSGHSNQIPA